MFGQRLDHATRQAKRTGGACRAVFIDLDRSRSSTTRSATSSATPCCATFAQRLTRACAQAHPRPPRRRRVRRAGSKKFSAPMFIASVAQKLIAAAGAGFPLAGKENHVSASIGASVLSVDNWPERARAAHKNTHIPMYRAKEQVAIRSSSYAAEQNIHTVERLTLESGLRRALEPRAARAALPAAARSRQRPHLRRGSAGALAAPGGSDCCPGELHRDRRGNRTHRGRIGQWSCIRPAPAARLARSGAARRLRMSVNLSRASSCTPG